jgi:ribosome-associated translation inhibitor RaiA
MTRDTEAEIKAVLEAFKPHHRSAAPEAVVPAPQPALMTRDTDAAVKAALDKLSAEMEAILGKPVARPTNHHEITVGERWDTNHLTDGVPTTWARTGYRPALRPPVAARPYRSHGNVGELLQLIFFGIPFGLLATYITIKIIILFF